MLIRPTLVKDRVTFYWMRYDAMAVKLDLKIVNLSQHMTVLIQKMLE